MLPPAEILLKSVITFVISHCYDLTQTGWQCVAVMTHRSANVIWPIRGPGVSAQSCMDCRLAVTHMRHDGCLSFWVIPLYTMLYNMKQDYWLEIFMMCRTITQLQQLWRICCYYRFFFFMNICFIMKKDRDVMSATNWRQKIEEQVELSWVIIFK